MMGSYGCEILIRNSHQKTVKLQLFHEKEKKMVFKFSKPGCNPARALLSKHEAIEFEERTSPIEVLSLSPIFLNLVFVSSETSWLLRFTFYSMIRELEMSISSKYNNEDKVSRSMGFRRNYSYCLFQYVGFVGFLKLWN